jgi:gamma-glutamylcyclotransferase (GGCT)/AIG2-like uncharacterized protein YtfP
MSRVLYFAYGSNLSRSQMRQRCPKARAICPATLPGWRWLIGERGFATIAAAHRGAVHGALYSLSEIDQARLDICEGVSSGKYGKFFMEVETIEGSTTALVYIDPRTIKGSPCLDYIERCVQGANEWGLDDHAVNTMQTYRFRAWKKKSLPAH